MSSTDAGRSTATDERRDRAREIWALGDYDRVARHVLAPLGTTLVEACAIGPDQTVLDVAAGTGTVAIAAAEAGACVSATASSSSTRRAATSWSTTSRRPRSCARSTA